MNLDALKLAELRETRRNNLAKEEIEATKAGISDYGTKAAAIANRAKAIESAAKATGSIMKMVGKNSPEWEVPADSAALDTALLSFFSRSWGKQQKLGAEQTFKDYGLAVLNWFPVIGKIGSSMPNPLFSIFKSLYDFIRGKNRGATNYSVNDLAGYYLPILSVYVRLAEIERGLKVQGLFSNQENYIGSPLVNACGFEADMTLVERYRILDAINIVKTQLKLIPMPVNFHVLQRWVYLASYVFLDSKDQIVQVIVPRSGLHYSYDGGTGANAATIAYAYKDNVRTHKTVTAILSELESLVKEISYNLANQTYQAIAGDIYNAFGSEGLITITPADDSLFSDNVLVYDEEFLCSLINATVLPFDGPSHLYTKQFDVTLSKEGFLGQGMLSQDGTQHLPFVYAAGTPENVTFIKGHTGCNAMPVLGYHSWEIPVRCMNGWDTLTPAAVVMATRFCAGVTKPAHAGTSYTGYYYNSSSTLTAQTLTVTAGSWMEVETCGTELVAALYLYGVDGSNSEIPTDYNVDGVITIGSNYVGPTYVEAHSVSLVTARWDHFIPLFNQDKVWFTEVPDSFGVMPRHAFDNMTYNVLLQLWNAPVFTRGSLFKDSKNHFDKPKSGKGHGSGKSGQQQKVDAPAGAEKK